MDDVLIECFKALSPYLNQLVLVGGWVPYIYRKMYGSDTSQQPLFTRDFDIAIPRHGFHENETPLNELILDAGFDYKFASLQNPPVVKYQKTMSNGSMIEIEFITEEPGNREDVKIIGSINAQALRDVGMLLNSPVRFHLSEYGYTKEGYFLVPRPSMFIIHKAIVAPKRRQKEKTAKDLYYIFYIIESFSLWRGDIFSGIRAAQNSYKSRASKNLLSYFNDLDSEGLDLLLSQRPQTAFSDMTEDQFRQYALSLMKRLIVELI